VERIPAAPYSAELRQPVAFWTGTDLIVAGGYEWPKPYFEVTYRTQTYAYSVESGAWRELEPLSVPGYDGVHALTGAWTGAAWIGVGIPCRDGEATSTNPTMGCDRVPVGLRWTPEAGWSSTGPVPAEAMSPERLSVSFAGQTSTALILATSTGYLSQGLGEGPDGSWQFTAWPGGAEPVTNSAACVVGDTIMTICTILGPAGPDLAEDSVNQPDDYPQLLSTNRLTPDGLLPDTTVLIDVPSLTGQPYCQPGLGLYVSTTLGGPLFQINVEGTVELPVDTQGSIEEPPIWVLSEWIDVGTGLVYLTEAPGGYYLDSTTGAVTRLQPVPTMLVAVWTGQVLFTSSRGSGQWFAFLPRSSWPESGDLDFPFAVEDDW